ncbi:MAG: DUF3226 domain-containing protein [Bryobacteraceae bacterium]
MPRKRDYPKILIVEGVDDKHCVIGLMKHHIDWPEASDGWPVWIEVGNSVDEILVPAYVTTEIKASNAKIVGVVLDSDLTAAGRYDRVRQLCTSLFPSMPAAMPKQGLIVHNEDKRFGLWVMPDNSSPGDLETFLRYLVPEKQNALWHQACQSVAAAVSAGADCRSAHIMKAQLYTWLAWQDPPGYSPGLALTRKILDPQSEYAAAFVRWFRELYQI